MAPHPAPRHPPPVPTQTALDLYLSEVARIRALPGTKETSFYPALSAAMNLVGATLRPKVYALHHPQGGAAGIPDFGLFDATAFTRRTDRTWADAVAPDRGVVEVKGADRAMATLASDPQVTKYRAAFGLVLITNLRQFWLLDRDGNKRDSLDLAPTASDFWALATATKRPPGMAERFESFLSRALRTAAPLTKPADLAFFLASYARDALTQLEAKASLPALKTLRDGMEGALGLAFEGKDGERLFRSTLVQTLFYGVFSAWIAHVRDNPGRFDWRLAEWSLHVPVSQFLFQQVATPQALGPLGIMPLLDAAGATLDRVDRPAFFANFEERHAVRYFYEPFLEYFDPDLRKQLGVWYTPPEIVDYMVERVDRVLRDELGIADGLADESVWVLDPCCGTGSYGVAVLDRIRRTLQDRGLGDLLPERLRRAATTRIVGFEIMTAPFVIAHWQVGEALRRVQAPLAEGERAAIYLTNALTGWDEEAVKDIPGMETLTAERAAANGIKRGEPILVVLGNPPYNAFAGVATEAEGDLVRPYKEGLQERWGIRKFNLDDLYVRFFRIAERRVERTGRGAVCFISNHSWLNGASFTVMRERLLSVFDTIWVDGLNGDSRETGKVTPDGKPDPSVFSTPFNREGIRVGTAITTMVRRA